MWRWQEEQKSEAFSESMRNFVEHKTNTQTDSTHTPPQSSVEPNESSFPEGTNQTAKAWAAYHSYTGTLLRQSLPAGKE